MERMPTSKGTHFLLHIGYKSGHQKKASQRRVLTSCKVWSVDWVRTSRESHDQQSRTTHSLLSEGRGINKDSQKGPRGTHSLSSIEGRKRSEHKWASKWRHSLSDPVKQRGWHRSGQQRKPAREDTCFDTVWFGELTVRHSGSLDASEHRDWCKSRGWPAQPGAAYGETWSTYWTGWSWLDLLFWCAYVLIIIIPVLPYIKGWCHRLLISFSDWLINELHCPVVVQPRLLCI